MKWLVWSSGLGRCVVAVETQVRTLRLAHYSPFFFHFLIVHYIFTCEPDFAKTKKFSQHSQFIAKHFIHLKEYIIVHTRNNNSKGMAFGYVVTLCRV